MLVEVAVYRRDMDWHIGVGIGKVAHPFGRGN